MTSAKYVCHVLDRPGQLIRIDSGANVSKPLNWKDLPDRAAADFDVAFPFVARAPEIEPLPGTTRDGIVNASFPPAEDKECLNGKKPKTQKANDDDDRPRKKKKRQASNDDSEPPRRKRRPRYPDDDYGGGPRGVDIIIKGGIGLGGYGRPGGYGGRPSGGNGGYGGR